MSGSHICQPNGSFTGGSCSACPAGQSSPDGSWWNWCSNCPSGQSSSLGGVCEDCLAGKSSISGGLCEDCPAGQSSISGGSCTENTCNSKTLIEWEAEGYMFDRDATSNTVDGLGNVSCFGATHINRDPDSGAETSPTITCPSNGLDFVASGCNPIPVDCSGSWGDYSACSLECGGGERTREYIITTPAQHGGTCAEEDTTESEPCNTESCAICRDYTCSVGYQDPNNQTQCNGPNSNDCDDTICCQAQPTNVQCGAGQELQEGTPTSVTTCVDCGAGTFSTGGNECIDHTVTGCPDGHSYTAGTTTTDSSCTANPCTNSTIANSNRTDSNPCSGVTDYTCGFTCNQGYRKSGEHTCQPSGSFIGGSCLANPCTNSTIENSITTCSGVTDYTCNFICNRGYTKSGVHT